MPKTLDKSVMWGVSMLLLAVNGGDLAEDVFAHDSACLETAEAQIVRAPDKQEFHPTTSWSFKRDLAKFFCERESSALTVLELGIFRGYTTAVLSAIFGRVMAVDIENDYLEQSASYNKGRQNVVFLHFDSFSDDWQLFRANSIDVVFIDADHSYQKVRADAINALSHLKPAAYLVFDDFGMEVDVRRVVQELEESGAITNCEFLGLGKDGQPWELKGYDLVNASEGVVCQRGHSIWEIPAQLDEHPFFVYPANPADPLMRAQGLFSFRGDGTVWTSPWGAGQWFVSKLSSRRNFALNISIPSLAPGLWVASFNRPLSSFLLVTADDPFGSARLAGLRSEKINQVFRIASDQFGEP